MTEAEDRGIDDRLEQDLKETKDMHAEIKESSERTEEEYDEKIKSLDYEEHEVNFDDLENRYRELKKEVSEARKNDHDVFLAHNLLLGFPTKLELAKATKETEDVEKAENILKEAEQELSEAKHHKKVDVRSEVEARVKAMTAMEGGDDEEETAPEDIEEVRESEAFTGATEAEKEETGKRGVDLDACPESPEQYFHLYNGKDLKCLKDLADYLPEMTQEMFEYYYTSRGKNDFAEWVENVFGYEDLADEIDKVRDRKEMARLIKEAS